MTCLTLLARTASWTHWRNFGQWRGPFRRLEGESFHSLSRKVDALERRLAMRCLVLAVVNLVGKCLSLKFWQNVRLVVGFVWVEVS